MKALRKPFALRHHLPSSAVRAVRAGSAALVALFLAVSLTACSGDDAPPATVNQGEEGGGAKPSTSPGVISPKLDSVPKLKNSVGVVKDAKLTDCSTEPGKVKAGGTVVNSADKTRDIVVVVSWVTPTSDVVARGVTAVKKLKAGKSADWSASSTLKYDGSAQCVMTVNAGELAT